MYSSCTVANRPATLEEMEFAHHAMTASRGMNCIEREFLAAEISQAKDGHAMANSRNNPLVVRDFYAAADSGAQFLLVPPGQYNIPADFFRRNLNRCIIGLAHDQPSRPTLMLSGLLRENTLAQTENEPALPPRVIEISGVRFLNIRIDAHLPTILEIGDIFMRDFLTEHLHYVVYGQNIDVFDALEDRLCLGRHWAQAAYGHAMPCEERASLS